MIIRFFIYITVTFNESCIATQTRFQRAFTSCSYVYEVGNYLGLSQPR